MPIHGYPGGVITANPIAPTSSVASGVWTTEQQLIAKAAGNWPFTIPTQQISRSLRFNSADSAYLSRTFGSNGNQKAWTLSFWVKRSKLGDFFDLFGVNAASPDQKNFRFNSDDTLTFYVQTSAATVVYLQTSQVFRDVSAWYHVVLVIDTANATSTDRIRLYANGSRITAFSSTTYPSLNLNIPSYNTAITHYLGSFGPGTSLFNGYMTEVNFVDGQALTPSSFGQTNASTGVWEPIAYTGTYGTNGFYLNFSDNSNTTAATLGKDYSGNGNNWTPNNFSVTAGAGNDSLVDTPTSYGTDTGVGGEVRGNYCTWNPIAKSAAVLLSNGNLNGSSDASLTGGCSGTIAVTSGKWYWETTIITFDGASAHGILKLPVTNNYATSEPGSYKYLNGGDVRIGDGSNIPYGASYGAGDVVGVALDLDNGKVFFSKNGVFQNSGNPVSGTNPAFSSLSGTFTAWCQDGSFTQVDTWATNFGQRPFAYTAPSGFKALCTQNLPTPTIGATSTTQADDYFDAVLWSGDSSLSRNITGWDFNLDFLWVKQRNAVRDHWLVDRVRGVQKGVVSNTGAAEATDATATNAFVDGSGANASGFTAGNGSAVWAGVNGSGNTYVGWGWKANGAGSTNTAGTITSTVSANTTSGFSIVTYTGNGTSGATIGHGLGVAPSMIMIRCRNSGAVSWGVYHASVGNTAGLYLNLTNAATTTSIFWNNTSPTSSVFSVGNWAGVNGNTDTYVAYCFAPVAGYSAFGSYTGNASTDGPFIYTGFRPRFIFGKDSGGTNNWWIFDSARDTYNVAGKILRPNLSDAELDSPPRVDLLSNGFKIRSVNLPNDATTYIYAAFAESPFKYALAR